jgi:hypothetical protein
MKQFKIRSSAIGEIMGIKGIGKTGESYLKKWYLENKYKRKKEFWANQIEKGLRVEPIGIAMLSRKLNVELSKNDEWFENDLMQGTPDIILDDEIIDIKCSWDIFSFPWFDKEIPNKDYYWQLQGYMALTGMKKASLVYCLIDTPDPLIALELKKLYYQSGGVAEDWTPETNAELAENYKFNDIPEQDRIIKFDIERNDEDIELIYKRVAVCRDYLNSVIPIEA